MKLRFYSIDLSRCEDERLAELDMLKQRGLATWSDERERMLIRRRQAIREFRRERETPDAVGKGEG